MRKRLALALGIALLAGNVGAEPSPAIVHALAYNLPLHLQLITTGGGTAFVGGPLTATTSMANDVSLFFGTAADTTVPGIIFATADTPDTGLLFTGSLSNCWIIAEGADKAFDFAHAQQTDPCIWIHSHNQSTTQWLSLKHDGTNGIIDVGAGELFLRRVGATWLGTNADGIDIATRSYTGGASFGAEDVFLSREAAGTWQVGVDVNGAPIIQTIKAHDGITGTDVKGAPLYLKSGLGTGAAVTEQATIWRDIVKATGTTAQTYSPAFTPCITKTLSNTTATAQTVAVIDLPSNSAAGAEAHITVTCTDGTNFNSETQTTVNSFVNKAGVLTITAAAGVTTATSASNNNGSCTIGATWVAGTNQVLLKVTPVFTTIVPTTVTGYVEVITHQPSAVAVACQ